MFCLAKEKFGRMWKLNPGMNKPKQQINLYNMTFRKNNKIKQKEGPCIFYSMSLKHNGLVICYLDIVAYLGLGNGSTLTNNEVFFLKPRFRIRRAES